MIYRATFGFIPRNRREKTGFKNSKDFVDRTDIESTKLTALPSSL